jgi:hypothetical protein
MDQRSIALYLSMKGLSAKAIHQGLVQALGAQAVAYFTITSYLRAAKFHAQSKEALNEAGVTRTGSVDTAILKALTDNPFSFVPELSRLMCLLRSTVHRCLTESLGFTVRHPDWIPHQLSDDWKTTRVNLSRELLRVLQRQQTRGWHNIMTLDELWLYLSPDSDRIWLTPEQPVPDRERHTAQSPKSMFAVTWNSSGFHVVIAFPKVLLFNAGYYTTEMLKRMKN